MSESPQAVQPALPIEIEAAAPEGADFERFLAVSPDMFAIFDFDGAALFANRSWFEALGYSQESVLGGNLLWLVHEDDHESLTAAFIAVATGAAESRAPTRARFRDARGRYHWIDWSGVADRRTRLVYTIARDVTAEVEQAEVREELLAAFQEHATLLAQQAAALDSLRKQAERLARFDSLTGVLNRGAWFNEVQTAGPTSLAIVDIDHFKRINDTYGHPAGDTILREVARRIVDAVGPEGEVGRTGGEEFAVMFAVPIENAAEACRRILDAVAREPFHACKSKSVNLTVSVGLAPWQAGRGAASGALARTYEESDRALYRAKAFGRNQLALPVLHHVA